ncbi:MAG TPA: ACP S-malonyltransferase [Solirubrobacteraceae bacterium]|jgi:malonyl CoA-acyl carrier protein transacylase|nr:ACP S-malonyltransferase [Solirubrobacteraceae bacterium]
MSRSSATPSATAALFPGQGVSLAGGRELVEQLCPQPYERCCELLGEDPFERAAQSTRFAQPAIFLSSIAGWRALEDSSDALGDSRGGADPRGAALAGHSLGELSALTAASVFALEDALALVVLRGALMADAAERHRGGGMLAILKGTPADAESLARAHGVEVANDNAPGQTILSGDRSALEDAAADARERGLRAMRLDVTGAFHSRAMQSACEPFLDALATVELAEPRVPVYSSMTAAPFRDVRAELAQALVRPVRWRETMLALHAAGARRFLDVGPDRVLARLVDRNVADSEALVGSELAAEVSDGVHA